MYNKYLLSPLLLLAFVFGLCCCDSNEKSKYSGLDSWREWAESSGSGLWLDQNHRILVYERVRVIGGESETQPIIFDAYRVATKGDSLLVTDRAQQCLVCLDSLGNVLWRFGEPGEGPGTFVYIMDVIVFGQYIAVSDNALGRIDLLTSDGQYINSIAVNIPQNLVTLSDTSFAVLTSFDSRGNVLVFSSSGDLLRSISLSTWDGDDCVFLKGTANDTGRLAVFSTMGDRFAILDEDLLEYEEYTLRDFPTEYPQPEVVRNMQGEGAIRMIPFVGNAFVGSCGELNLRLMPLTVDHEFWRFDSTALAPVSVIDRYDWDGHYLDSYVIPVSHCRHVLYSDSIGLIAVDADDSSINIFRDK